MSDKARLLMVELKRLAYFVAVAEELHFHRAAERLHIAQPALSQQVKKLEVQLGTKLLERTSRKVSLTGAGEVLLEEARHVLAASARAEAATKQASQGEAGLLRVGVVGSVAFDFAPRLLREFHSRFEKVRVELRELTTELQLAALNEGSMDVGIVRQLEEREDLYSVLLAHEPLVAAVPSNYIRLSNRATIGLAELSTEKFVYVPRVHLQRLFDQMQLLFQSADAELVVAEEALHFPQVIGMVAAGMGVSVVPSGVQSFRPDNVTYIPLDDPGAVSTISLVYSLRRHIAVRERFVEVARAVATADAQGL